MPWDEIRASDLGSSGVAMCRWESLWWPTSCDEGAMDWPWWTLDLTCFGALFGELRGNSMAVPLGKIDQNSIYFVRSRGKVPKECQNEAAGCLSNLGYFLKVFYKIFDICEKPWRTCHADIGGLQIKEKRGWTGASDKWQTSKENTCRENGIVRWYEVWVFNSGSLKSCQGPGWSDAFWAVCGQDLERLLVDICFDADDLMWLYVGSGSHRCIYFFVQTKVPKEVQHVVELVKPVGKNGTRHVD